MAQEDQEWPIYSLVGYDKPGLLIEQCHSLLSLTDTNSGNETNKEATDEEIVRLNKSQYCSETPCGHGTGCESWNRQQRQRIGGSNKGKKWKAVTCELPWWRLIEPLDGGGSSGNHDHGNGDEPKMVHDNNNNNNNNILDRLYQARVLELCYRIKLALR